MTGVKSSSAPYKIRYMVSSQNPMDPSECYIDLGLIIFDQISIYLSYALHDTVSW